MYRMLLHVRLATQAVTSVLEPLAALLMLSLDYLVKFKVLIPFFKASSGVILIHPKISLAGQNKDRIYSSSLQEQRQMETPT